MSITVELEPALEAALQLRAAGMGLSIEAYVVWLAENDVQHESLDPRILASIRMGEPLLGKLKSLPNDRLDLGSLYEVS